MSAKTGKSKDKPKTICEEGLPQDLEPTGIPRVNRTDVIAFDFYICRANSQILVYLDKEIIADVLGQDHVSLLLPMLGAGAVHKLYWSVLGAGEEWQTRAEIKINERVSFLRRKKNSDKNPALAGFWYFEVVK